MAPVLLWRRLRVVLVATWSGLVFGLIEASEDPLLTPTQERLLKEAHAAAVDASLRAESELLGSFGGADFRLKLLAAGGGSRLLTLPASELLKELKDNLAFLEYTSNFGLSAAALKRHPGQPAMDFDTIERYGHVPTNWELKRDHSPLAANVSEKQWKIFDAAETGLYGMPEFVRPHEPTAEEMGERPKYIAGNLRRVDIGLQRYGSFAAVVRNSVEPVSAPGPRFIERLMVRCDEVFAGRKGKGRPLLGVLDHQLHIVLANAKVFERIGGDLAQVVHQFLASHATLRPVEANMYTEQILFGPLRPVDMKVLVASFAGAFGTEEGAAAREYCRRHSVPLAWGLGAGDEWAHVEGAPLLLWPYEPFYTWPVGHGRLLDKVAGWSATNLTMPPDSDGVWEQVWAEVREARQHAGSLGPGRAAYQSWWDRLQQASGEVLPLRAGDCASADMCFGTHSSSAGSPRDCVCQVQAWHKAPWLDMVLV